LVAAGIVGVTEKCLFFLNESMIPTPDQDGWEKKLKKAGETNQYENFP